MAYYGFNEPTTLTGQKPAADASEVRSRNSTNIPNHVTNRPAGVVTKESHRISLFSKRYCRYQDTALREDA